ncbi:MAG: bifunctional hydroxymethylpyrimidine kinase/phosphomethylpyrimidine kinase [Rhodospirillales bacterium]|nr:bifunctional hydroxymethylpyrimidine kinase/phosphomethylpyrimidine kinase [Rhodospirillales bacterium]
MDVISLQSRVRTGYVGNAIAVPTLERTGVTAHAVDTVTYDHHPGHGPVTPEVTVLADIRSGLDRALQGCGDACALLSGYLANAEQGHVALDFVEGARGGGNKVTWYLDPVFGDDAEGIYVDPAIVGFFRDRAIPACDAVLPNRFELATLTDTKIEDSKSAVAAARKLMARGPSLVFVSSIPTSHGSITNLLVTETGAEEITVPKRPLRAKGTGDMLSAAFTGLHVSGSDPRPAAQSAVAAVNAAVEDASDRDAVELDPTNSLTLLDIYIKNATVSTYTESLE